MPQGVRVRVPLRVPIMIQNITGTEQEGHDMWGMVLPVNSNHFCPGWWVDVDDGRVVVVYYYKYMREGFWSTPNNWETT